MTNKKELTIKINKDSIWKIATVVFAALFVISLVGGFDFEKSEKPKTGAVVDLTDDDHVLGDPNAPVTIVEFSDYECPFCARFWSDAYQQIKTEYIDTGKVKLVFRDFPLSFHQDAQKAAEAAECAGEQDQYYEMHDKIFGNQQAIDVNSLKAYAQDLGLDMDEFNTCLDSGEMADEVQADFQDGVKAGVQGTPAFFINGKSISGAQPFSVFQEAIEAEL